jgi:hypothetical protein
MKFRHVFTVALLYFAAVLGLFTLSCGPSPEQLKQKKEREITLAHDKSEQLFKPYLEEFLRPYREYTYRERDLEQDRSRKSEDALVKMHTEVSDPKNAYITGKVILIGVDTSGGDYTPHYDDHNDDFRLNENGLIARTLDEVGTVVYVSSTDNKGPAVQSLKGGQTRYLTSTSYNISIIDRKASKVIGNKAFTGEFPQPNAYGTYSHTWASPDIVPYLLSLPRK